jgi:hypothetical protein
MSEAGRCFDRICLSSFFFLMPMSMMDVGHVSVLMFFGGMFMLMRMDSVHFIMLMSRIIVSMAVLVE